MNTSTSFVVVRANVAAKLRRVCDESETNSSRRLPRAAGNARLVSALDMFLEIDHRAPLAEAKELLREYPDSIPVELEAADYEAWLATLPGPYAPPGGALLVARVDGAGAGCVCVRGLDAHTGEIKRMYVREPFRGRGIGRALVTACIEVGRKAGYSRMRLDTHSTMTPARKLYEAFGFVEIPAYWDHPIPGVVFYELAIEM